MSVRKLTKESMRIDRVRIFLYKAGNSLCNLIIEYVYCNIDFSSYKNGILNTGRYFCFIVSYQYFHLTHLTHFTCTIRFVCTNFLPELSAASIL